MPADVLPECQEPTLVTEIYLNATDVLALLDDPEQLRAAVQRVFVYWDRRP